MVSFLNIPRFIIYLINCVFSNIIVVIVIVISRCYSRSSWGDTTHIHTHLDNSSHRYDVYILLCQIQKLECVTSCLLLLFIATILIGTTQTVPAQPLHTNEYIDIRDITPAVKSDPT